jgi:intraflagellar transport protein 46
LRSAELAPPSPSPSGSQAPSPRGPYNPEALSRLDVSPEVQELFSLIARFKPVDIQLETKLVPFVPEFIPAVGEPDAFLKVPRPDGKDDGLGLTVVDEPGKQSDPAVLFFKLENTAKVALAEPLRVQSIEHAEKNPQKVASWIANMQEVHRQRPPTTVHFSQPMPDVEALMQVWPDEFESALKDAELPSADLDLSLAEYARVCCALLDIPVHGRLVESLHLLFTLYSEFRSNPHFQQHA